VETIKIKGFNPEIELILAGVAAVLITAIVVLIISAASNGDNVTVKRVAPAIILSLVCYGLALKKTTFPIGNNSLVVGFLVMAVLFILFPVSVLILLVSIKEFFAHWWKIALLNGTASLIVSSAVLSFLSPVIERVPWRFSLSFFFITAAFCFVLLV